MPSTTSSSQSILVSKNYHKDDERCVIPSNFNEEGQPRTNSSSLSHKRKLSSNNSTYAVSVGNKNQSDNNLIYQNECQPNNANNSANSGVSIVTYPTGISEELNAIPESSVILKMTGNVRGGNSGEMDGFPMLCIPICPTNSIELEGIDMREGKMKQVLLVPRNALICVSQQATSEETFCDKKNPSVSQVSSVSEMVSVVDVSDCKLTNNNSVNYRIDKDNVNKDIPEIPRKKMKIAVKNVKSVPDLVPLKDLWKDTVNNCLTQEDNFESKDPLALDSVSDYLEDKIGETIVLDDLMKVPELPLALSNVQLDDILQCNPKPNETRTSPKNNPSRKNKSPEALELEKIWQENGVDAFINHVICSAGPSVKQPSVLKKASSSRIDVSERNQQLSKQTDSIRQKSRPEFDRSLTSTPKLKKKAPSEVPQNSKDSAKDSNAAEDDDVIFCEIHKSSVRFPLIDHHPKVVMEEIIDLTVEDDSTEESIVY